jgi:hypothetical protein
MAQRIGVLADAPGEVLQHERATRFVHAPMRDEDEDQQTWRTLVGRAARILPGYLQDGTVELRLSDFTVLGTHGIEEGRSQMGGPPEKLLAQPRMAAKSSSVQAAFLAALGQSEETLLVDELDCDCGGSLQLVASRRGLAILFTSQDRDAVPPAVTTMAQEGTRSEWQLGTGSHAGASRIFFPHDWRAGPFSLRISLLQPLSLRVVDDGRFR